jgi:chaperonin GroES
LSANNVLFAQAVLLAAQFPCQQPRVGASDAAANIPTSPIQSGASMALRPLNDRVIIKRLDNERKTASGIVIPESAAEKPDQGEILAVGPGKRSDDGKLTPVDVKVGDKVLFGKYAGQSVKVDGEELLVIREEEILAVIQ